MAAAQIHPATWIEDAGKTLLARVQNPSGTNITQATLSSIAYIVKDQAGTTTGSGSITISAAVFDTLQGASGSDARWSVDTTGYNFRFELPASCFPAPGSYRAEVWFTPTSGAAFCILWEGPCLGVENS